MHSDVAAESGGLAGSGCSTLHSTPPPNWSQSATVSWTCVPSVNPAGDRPCQSRTAPSIQKRGAKGNRKLKVNLWTKMVWAKMVKLCPCSWDKSAIVIIFLDGNQSHQLCRADKKHMQLHPFMVGLHVCHLQLQEHHVLCAFLLARRTPRPGRAVKPTSGHRCSHDFSCLIPSVWILVIHFIKSLFPRSSWISWACRKKTVEFLSQNVVSVFSWNTLFLSRLIGSLPLCQTIFWKQIARLQEDFQVRASIFQIPVHKCHTNYQWHLRMKPWRLTVKTKWDLRRHLNVVISWPPWNCILCVNANES